VGQGAAAAAGSKENLTYLTSSIDDLRREVLVLPLDHFAERVLDSRVITIDKVAVDELHRHTGLACTIRVSYIRVVKVQSVHVKAHECACLPTALLPTMAIFLCFGGAGILLACVCVCDVCEVAERLASVVYSLSPLLFALVDPGS
jgi:hypothetical protein